MKTTTKRPTITDDLVRDVLERHARGESQASIAAALGLGRSMVSRIVTDGWRPAGKPSPVVLAPRPSSLACLPPRGSR